MAPGETSEKDTHCYSSLSTYLGAFFVLLCTILLFATVKIMTTHCENSGRMSPVSSTKLNTAVCVSGQLRTLTLPLTDEAHTRRWHLMRSTLPFPNQTVAESIQRNLFPKLHDPDVFMTISTREREREPKHGNLSVCEPLRPKGGHLSCAVPLETPYEQMGNETFWNDFIYQNYVGIQGLLQQLKGMYDCYKQIEKHSIVTGKKYDWIVRLRPDIYIHDFPDIELVNSVQNVYKKVLYANTEACCCGNEDTFGMGRYDVMVPYLERFAHLQHGNIFEKGKTFSAESHLVDYMKERGVTFEQHAMIQTCVVKPSYRTTISQPR